MPGLFLVDASNNLTPLAEAKYESEDLLQTLLADHPALLGGDQMGTGEPRKWLFLAREASVPDSESSAGRWSLDHLFLDQDAVLTFVEVKRASDSRIRREVVGQMLDYAANGLKYWPLETLQSMVATLHGDANGALAEAFGESVDPDSYWKSLRENMENGRVRLVFVADRIPSELLSVVEFLNRQMDRTDVLAVEIPLFEGEGQKMLAPRVLGLSQESAQRKSPGPRGRSWDEGSFFAELESKRSASEVAEIRKYYEWIRAQGWRVVFGRGVAEGSFWGKFKIAGVDYPYPVFCYTNAEMQFGFGYLAAPFDDEGLRAEFVRRLNAAPGLELSEETTLPGMGYPWRPSSAALGERGFRPFTEAILWYKAQAERAAGVEPTQV